MPFEETIKSIPQADTDRIARRLLGDQVVDNYGDVIGARKHTMRDVARDFALGVAGGPTKSGELRLKVQEQFQKAYDKEAKAAAVRKQQDREQATMVLGALKTVSGLPPGQRASIFKDTLDQAGIPYSNAAVKFLTDADTLAQLPLDQLMEKAQSGEISTASIGQVFGSAQQAANWYTNMVRAQKDREQTGNMILDHEIKTLKLKDIQAKMVERDRQAAMREQGLRERIKAQKLSNVSKRQKLTKGAGGGLLTGIDPTIAAAMSGPTTPRTSVTPAAPAVGTGVEAAPAPATPGIKAITQVR